MEDKKLGSFTMGRVSDILSDSGAPNKITMVPIGDLVPGKNQPRKEFGNLDELAGSIRKEGIIEPLIVRKKGIKYEIIAGERRLRAAQQLPDFKELPCIVMNVKDNRALEMSLIENLQREDLNPIEQTEGIINLLNLRMSEVEEFQNFNGDSVSVLNAMYNYKQGKVTHNVMSNLKEITEEVFSLTKMKWESFLKNYVPLLRLSPELKDALINNKEFKPAHAREISKVDDPEKRKQLIQIVLKDNMGLRELKEKISEYQKKPEEGSQKTGSKKKNDFLIFDEIPNLKIKPRKNRFTLDINLKKGNLLETLTRFVDLVKQGRIEVKIS